MVALDKFVEKCKLALGSTDPACVVEALVLEAIADPGRLRVALEERVTDTTDPYLLLFRSADLTIVNVVTVPGLRSPIHDHNMWAVIGLYAGEEQHSYHQEKDGDLKQVGERLLRAGDVAVLEPETIHAVANPLPRKSDAIHVYGGDAVTRAGRSMWNPRTLAREEFSFDRSSEYTRELSANA